MAAGPLDKENNMLTGKTNEEKIWNYLTSAGLNACGAAGLMGNLYA